MHQNLMDWVLAMQDDMYLLVLNDWKAVTEVRGIDPWGLPPAP